MSTEVEPAPGARPALRGSRPPTAPAHRLRAVVVYVGALLVWIALIGVPNDPIGVFLWLWGAGIAWNIDAPRSYHLRFPRDWWPVLLGLVVYWFTRGLADNLGLAVHVTMPIRFDTWVAGWFGSDQVPTETLQHALCGDPCLTTTPAHWWDLALSTVYASHFVTGLTIAAVLWVRHREAWVRWMRRYLALNYVSLAIYFLYPMAPPWLASNEGALPEVNRVTSRGWGMVGLDRANMVLQGMGNQVAAMPSLHAGMTFLVAAYGIWRLRSPLRFLLVLYPLAMCLALVYFAEHYVVDVLAGGVLAVAVMVVCGLWERRRPIVVEAVSAAAPGPPVSS